MIACPHCSRVNPPGARFCHHEGSPLGPVRTVSLAQSFSAPFVFPSGRTAQTFDELADACLEDWPDAVELLRTGALASFLYGVGRPDLAGRAREAALYPESDWALAQLLERLPTRSAPDARLEVPAQLDLGRLRVGQDSTAPLHLSNGDRGYLHGTIASDVPWLSVSPARFGCRHDSTVEVRVNGRGLRAALTPIMGRLTIESSGGTVEVTVRAEVPPITFAAGVLAGARTPRQLVEKAKSAPREAARLFEEGAVARWYANNGWIYPLQPSGQGPAIDCYFAALGLPAPEPSGHEITSVASERQSAEPAASDRPSPVNRAEIRAGSVSDGGDLSVADASGSDPAARCRPAGSPPPPQTREAPDEQPWFAPPPSAPAPAAAANDSLDWLPISRPERPARPGPPPLPIELTPVGRRPVSRLWLLLLPLGILVLAGLTGVGIVLSLPSAPRDRADAIVQIPEKTSPVTPAPVEKEKEPLKGTITTRPPPDDEGPRPVIRRPTPPVLVVPEFKTREVEVVFCLDTTGSMGALIRGTQQKIWAMCNQIAGGKPTPSLKVGLVAYRDRGDEYVTKVTDLSRDLDAVHQELLALKAEGGGDFPESVNQALDDAVNKITWSKDDRTLKIIFLVGDAPPHMDYTDDVKYPVTCKKASDGGIVINAIQCGVDRRCTESWKDIASKAGGEYVAIPQTGGVRVIDTPFDEELTKLMGKLMDTALIYGDERRKKNGTRMVEVAKVLRGPSGADRAAFAAKSKRLNPYDLLDDIASKRVKLEDVKAEELPDALKDLGTIEKRREYLAKVSAQRAELQAEALELEKKRAAHLERVRSGDGGKDGFDGEVLKLLRKQAKKFEIDY